MAAHNWQKEIQPLIKKYKGRALFITTSACAMHCRFCFRQKYDYLVEDKTFEKAIEEAGQVVKNYQSNVVLYERVSKNLPGEKPKLKKLKEYKVIIIKSI